MFTGQQIRDKRKKEGLSVAELATRLSVSEQSLYKWEKGTRPNNAQDYLKVENWLKKGLESIPENHNGKMESDTELKAKIDVLFDVAVEVLSAASGKSSTLIRKELEKRVDELKRFAGG